MSTKLGTDAYVVVGPNNKCCEKEDEIKFILKTSVRQIIV